MAIIFYDKQILRYLTVYRGSGGGDKLSRLGGKGRGGSALQIACTFAHLKSRSHCDDNCIFFAVFFCSIPTATAMEKIEFFSPFHFFFHFPFPGVQILPFSCSFQQKQLQNNTKLGVGAPHLRKILDPPLTRKPLR